MAQIKDFQLSGVEVVRPTVLSYGDVRLLLPWMRTITRDYSGGANAFTQVNTAGIPTPDAAPTFVLGAAPGPTGTYTYRITFYDTNTDAEGNPSAPSLSATPANQRVTLTFADTNSGSNSRVTHRRVYRNTNGSTIFRRLATVAVATGTYLDQNLDTDIINLDTLTGTNTAPGAYGTGIVHRGYAMLGGNPNGFGGGAKDSQIVWGKAGSLDQFPYWQDVDLEPGLYGIFRGFVQLSHRLALFKDTGIFVWQWDDDPHKIYGNGHIEEASGYRGSLNNRCAQNVQGKIYAMDAAGIYKWNGGSSFRDLTPPLRKFWERINWAKRHLFFIVSDEKRIWFFVALDSDNYPHHAFVYDLTAESTGRPPRWWVEYYDFEFVDGVNLPLMNSSQAETLHMTGLTVPTVLTKAGYWFQLGLGYRDGLPQTLGGPVKGTSALRPAIVTAASATGTTIVVTNSDWDDTFQSAARNAKGLYVRCTSHPEDFPDAYRITGVSGTTLTIAGLPSTPATGSTWVVGPIPRVEYLSSVMAFGAPEERKESFTMLLEYTPLPQDTSLRLQFIKDRTHSEDVAYTENVTGRQLTAGDNFGLAKFGGKAYASGGLGVNQYPVGGRAFNYIQFTLGCGQPVVDSPVAIDAFTFTRMRKG